MEASSVLLTSFSPHPLNSLSTLSFVITRSSPFHLRGRAVLRASSVSAAGEVLVKHSNPISTPQSPAEFLPKIDKSGRFCSPRAARELAMSIIYAACLEGSDPVRLFEKRVNSRREPDYDFDKTLLNAYSHMSFAGPPVNTNTVEEAGELIRNDEKESAIAEAFPSNV